MSVHGELLVPRGDGCGELLQHQLSILPADAGVGDADAVLETRTAFRPDFLRT